MMIDEEIWSQIWLIIKDLILGSIVGRQVLIKAGFLKEWCDLSKLKAWRKNSV